MIEGIWLPIITPFKNDNIDYISYEKLINHYIAQGISGIIPLGTTGESPTITEYEYEQLIERTLTYVNGRVPVYVGLGSNFTAKLKSQIKRLRSMILMVSYLLHLIIIDQANEAYMNTLQPFLNQLI